MKLNLERIDKELRDREWTRYRLAKEMGINPKTIYTILKGGSFKTVKAISRVLDIPETDLVVGG